MLDTSHLSEAKRRLLERQLRGDLPGALTEPAPRATQAGVGPAPLATGQRQVWLHAQLAPDLPMYNEPVTIYRTGPLDVEALRRSLAEIVRRHEAWRTSYPAQDGQPVPVIQPPAPVPLPTVDLLRLPVVEREAEAARLAAAEARRPFDLARGPLLRATLVRVGEADHRLYMTLHHLIFDAVAIYQVMLPELVALYDAFARGAPSPLAELPMQYGDVARWQRERLDGDGLAAGLAYWRRRLDGLPVLELPVDRPRPAAPTFRGGMYRLALSSDLSVALKALCRREHVTLFVLLLAAFQVLLQRWSGQDDVVVGTVVSTRKRPELDRLLGYFLNTLLLRTDLACNPSFRELLGRVRDVVRDALAHDETPFELVAQELRRERPGRVSLVQAMFSLQPPLPALGAGWGVGQMDVDTGTAKFDLYLELDERAEGVIGRFVYSADLFEAATIARLAERWQTLLGAIVRDPGRRLTDLPSTTPAEREQLLVGWNATARPYPRDACIHELFARQVERNRGAIAVSANSEQMTYGELDGRAERLACRLQRLGVGPDTQVAICLERSPDLVVGLLAILKAGGAYVPLDPAYPRERLRGMLDDAGARVLLTDRRLLGWLPDGGRIVVCLDAPWPGGDKDGLPPLAGGVTAEHLAYVLYTSGSTGRPKGVAVSHRAVLRLVCNSDYAHVTASDRVAQVSSASFDALTFELWGALLHGARLVILSKDVVLSPPELARALRAREISTLFVTTALFNQVASVAPDAFQTVRQVLFGGEAADPGSVRRVLTVAPPRRLLHVYGPTETTTFATWQPVEDVPEEATTVPIGRPIANTRAYVLDAHLQPVPVGVAGELYIGGDGLARGYLNRPELTASAFLPDPFGDEPGGRLYRTGDVARYRGDGALEFLGRRDRQVKVRGYRVEPGEVEAALLAHPAVRQAVVVEWERGAGDRRLASYVVTAGRGVPTEGELRDFLRERLPESMVPAAFVHLAALPLTPNGKLDRGGLPRPEAVVLDPDRTYIAPRTELEAQLVGIWEELLGRRPVGVSDDFFALGGHSLLATRLMARIEQALGRRLPLAALLQGASVERLAERLGRPQPPPVWPSLVAIQPHGSRPPFFCVHGLYGDVLVFAELVRHLGTEQPFYAFQARGLDGVQEPLDRVEAMAACYLEELRAVQPHGPYCVGGYSSGGCVAFELARQLRAAGEEVALLAILDQPNPKADHTSRLWSPHLPLRLLNHLRINLPYLLTAFMRCPPDRRPAIVRRRLRIIWGTLAALAPWRQRESGGDGLDSLTASMLNVELAAAARLPEYRRKVVAAMQRALQDYVPDVYSGQLVLFRSRGQPLLVSDDPSMGWGGLAAGGVKTKVIPGNHDAMLHEPHALVLARSLRACLDEGFNLSRTPPGRP